MAITGVGSYNSVYENTYALSKKEAVKKEETKETAVMKKSDMGLTQIMMVK